MRSVNTTGNGVQSLLRAHLTHWMLDIDLALEHCAPKSLKKARELMDQAMRLLEEVRDGGCW